MERCGHTETHQTVPPLGQVALGRANLNVVHFEELGFIMREGNGLEPIVLSVGSRHQLLARFKSENLALWGGRCGRNGHSWPRQAGIGIGQLSSTP